MLATLSMLLSTIPFVAALLLGLLVPLLALLLYRRVEAGVVLVCLVFVTDAAFHGGARLVLGINIYSNDLAYGLLLAVTTARWLLAREMPARPRVWLLFALLIAGSLVVGFATHGRRAGVQGREVVYLLTCASYAMSFAIDEQRLRRLLHTLAAACVALLAVVAYRWTVYALQIRELLPPSGEWGADGSLRVITSNETLLLAQWLLLGLFFAGTSGAATVGRWLAPLLLAVVVVLQHRSVWIAAAVGVVAAFAAARASQGARLTQIASLLVAAALVALPLVYSERFADVSRQVGQSAAHAATGRGTVHARLQDWKRALDEFARSGPRQWAVGQGFGRDTERVTFDERGERRVIRFGVHNHYVALLVYVGAIGLGAYLAVLLGTVWGLYQHCRSGTSGWAAPVLLVLLLAQMAYHVPYPGDALQHLLLGAAMAWLATRRAAAAGSIEPKPAPRAAVVAWR